MSVIFCSLRSAHSRLPVWLVPSPSDSVFSISLLTRPDHCSSSAFGFFLLGLPCTALCFFFFFFTEARPCSLFPYEEHGLSPGRCSRWKVHLYLNLINSFVFRKSLHTVKCTQLKCVVQWVLITGYVCGASTLFKIQGMSRSPQRESLFLLSVNLHPPAPTHNQPLLWFLSL